MPGMAVEPEDETAAVPTHARVKRSHLEIEEEGSAEVRAAERRASRRVFRLYCFSCGRASESSVAPLRPGRCQTCGGTMLLELAAE
jgi:hypothetical protein